MWKLLNLNAGLGFGIALVFCCACGEEREPHAGYASPCDTPMGSVLGCPVTSVSTPAELTMDQACRKLVSCGILSQEYLHATGSDCQDSSDCDTNPGGECIHTDNGLRCHYPFLDLFWCASRLSKPSRADPCDSNITLSAQHMDSLLQCIDYTPCPALGLSFSDKRVGRDHRSALDKYTCKDGQRTIWTATICDFGLLSYDSQNN